MYVKWESLVCVPVCTGLFRWNASGRLEKRPPRSRAGRDSNAEEDDNNERAEVVRSTKFLWFIKHRRDKEITNLELVLYYSPKVLSKQFHWLGFHYRTFRWTHFYETRLICAREPEEYLPTARWMRGNANNNFQGSFSHTDSTPSRNSRTLAHAKSACTL